MGWYPYCIDFGCRLGRARRGGCACAKEVPAKTPFLLVLVFLAGLLLLAVLNGITSSLFGLLVMLQVAGIIGWQADLIVPGETAYGWLGAIVAGLLRAFVDTRLIGQVGPIVAGIPFIPALLGAIIVSFVANMLLKRNTGRQ